MCQSALRWLGGLLLAGVGARAAAAEAGGGEAPDQLAVPKFRVAQLVEGNAILRRNPEALPSLLREVARTTSMNVDDQPVIVKSFEDPALFECPFVFANFADRGQWRFSAREIANLRTYLEGGGFLFVDAGITAEFLRGQGLMGQHHSFGEWEADPDLQAAFQELFPEAEFTPLPRSHELFRAFYRGLPDPGLLPDTVRDFVVQEKWPEGTYSAVGLKVNGRLAVLATPIISMGWARNVHGGWDGTISFRIREGAANLGERLEQAAYAGERFEARREDGRQDIVFCQEPGTPAWVAEPDGNYRVFRYYHSREISDYAHTFFTRLGVNIMVFAATN